MRKPDIIPTKIYTLDVLARTMLQWKFLGKKIAFTNGVFDIIHRGHIYSLSQAASEADILVVGLNSDASTRELKGPARPVNDQDSRALVLASLLMVDAVVIFDEPMPINLITTLLPDVLVKGGDYTIYTIVGAKEVIANGGRVVINPIVEGFSTTGIIGRMKG